MYGEQKATAMVEQEKPFGQQVGEYHLLCLLGKGSFGAVYLAEHLHDHSQAAVKLLRFHLTSAEDFKGFLNEARTMRLRHQHIVPLLDFGLTRDNTPYLVMEYAAGGTLRQRYSKGTKLPFKTLDSYVSQLASALQYAHDRRVIHRDVKPENVLLRADGTLVLSDFGIAKVLEQSSFVSLQAQAAGTPAYMSPEQSRGKPCPASDQYALAVMVYEWLAGRLPFQGASLEVMLQHRVDEPPSLQDICPEVPIQVEQVVLQALKKTPEECFSTVEQFAEALHTALQQSSLARPTTSSMVLMTSPPDQLIDVPPVVVLSQSSAQSSLSAVTPEHSLGSLHPSAMPLTLPSDLRTPQSPQLAHSGETKATLGNQLQPSIGDGALIRQESRAYSSQLMPTYGGVRESRFHNKKFTARALVITLLCFVLLVSLAGGGI